jgi:leucyl-tRNA synthetase/predicted alpha/beta hydrolase family esterase
MALTQKSNFKELEQKWQQAWEDAKIFQAKDDSKKKKFYNLEMFPYPSASFLHMGHVRNYTIGDIIARFKRMQGFNVLYPMGYDSFGLPAENAAKKAGIHPKQYTEDAIKKIMEFQKALGNSYDWSRTISTHEPEYYKWNQWFFLKFLERGLVYRKKAPVNWCPECRSTLANEEVVDGCCWRHETTQVEQKELEQWFLKTTAYADELLKDLDKLNWSDRLKHLQRNWIGKSEGTLAKFKLKDSSECLEIFTTRIDTVFSVTFLVMAPEHPKALEFIKGTKKEKEATEFIKKVSRRDREDLSKEGFFTGRYAVNPATGEEIPIYLANFVVMDYGTGIVMADAHDKRDVEFAKKYGIKLKTVLKHKDGSPLKQGEVFEDFGILENSGEFNGLTSEQAIPKIRAWLETRKLGKKVVQYKLRDWLISRQRYWGTPIPIVYCENCSKQNILLIQGLSGSNSDWFPWLEKEAKKYSVDFVCPSLPSSERSDLTVWLKELEKYTKNLNENSIVIGYSLGGLAALHLVGSLKNKIGKLVLVAPASEATDISDFKDKSKEIQAAVRKFIQHKADWKKVQSNVAGDIVLYFSTNDDRVNVSSVDFFKKKLRGKYFVLDGRGHFNSGAGVTTLPELLEELQLTGGAKAIPVPEKELPVLLPERVDFKTAGNPIASAKDWLETKCPKCKSPAKRETDTMGGFVDSSWYFLRYCSPQENKAPFDKKAVEYWMPVNQYVGGIEHAVGHLIYSRFWTKALRDMGLLNFDEPFASLFNQGIVYKGGHKMSKSFGNVVYQTDISEKYGIDTARVFLMSVAAPESDMEWSDAGVEGSARLLQKISKIAELKFKKPDARDEHKRNIFIKSYTLFLETFKFNLAIIELARYADYLAENPTRDGCETLLILLSPFAPHTAEELWHKIGNTQAELRSAGPRNQRKFQKNFLGQENRQTIFSGSEAFSRESFVSVEGWPAVNEKAISKEIEQQEVISEKTIEDVRRIIKIVNVAPKKIYLYAIPKELDLYKSMTEKLRKEFSAEVEVWANNNVRKYDPEHKAEKAKPGKPGIYIEA